MISGKKVYSLIVVRHTIETMTHGSSLERIVVKTLYLRVTIRS